MTDIELNKLGVKSDSLPNDWYVSLINPENDKPGEIMTVARFTELFLNNNKVWTENNDGPDSSLYAGVARKLDTIAIPANKDLNNYQTEGWYHCPFTGDAMTLLNCPVRKAFSLVINRTSGDGYTQRLFVFDPTYPQIFIRNVYNEEWGQWHQISLINTASQESNSLTETIVEEIPISSDTPMTLQEDGQPAPTMQTVERYEYSIPKMAEAILAIWKELDELKA